ncbi:hypothetical protein ACTXNP_03005 [Pseudomonas helleri]|uniref:hypothetical protein n=1 Tax=Pseudomonas helleri TaxID=1608996 RepID=UPI003FD60AA9
MTTAAKHSIAFRLGRAFGAVARVCLHDRNPMLRWCKRVAVAALLLTVVVSSFSWLASSLISLACFGLVVLAFAKGDLSFLSSVLEHQAEQQRIDEENNSRVPFYGEYDHPEYYLYHKD